MVQRTGKFAKKEEQKNPGFKVERIQQKKILSSSSDKSYTVNTEHLYNFIVTNIHQFLFKILIISLGPFAFQNLSFVYSM